MKTSVFCPICGLQTPRGICPTHGPVNQRLPTHHIFAAGAIIGGRYRIDHVLSQDHSHTVVMATQLDVHRVVLIKTVAVERLAARAHELVPLFRESHAVSIFRRGKMVRIFDFAVEPMTQTPYLVMEYHPGRKITDIVSPNSMESRTVASFVEVAHGLLDTQDELQARGLATPPSSPMLALPSGPSGPAMPVSVGRPRPSKPRKAKAAPPSDSEKSNPWQTKWIRIGVPVGLVLTIGIYVATAEEYVRSSVGLQRKPGRSYAWSEEAQGRVGYRGEAMYKDGLRRSPMVRVTSTPSGAEVFDGRRAVGETPFSLKRPGSDLRLVLKFPGYLDRTVTVSKSSPGTVSVSLFKVSKHSDDALLEAKGKRYDPLDNSKTKPPSYLSPVKSDPFTKDPLNIPELPDSKPNYFND